jgi:hypothetical protein
MERRLRYTLHTKHTSDSQQPRGFTFCIVPLGCGSLQLPAITRQLLKHADPKMGMSIEMMNGQHFQVNWLEDGFWVPFRNRSAAQVAATLRHIRRKEIDRQEYKLVEEIDMLAHEEHVKFEQARMTRCIAYLKSVLDQAGSST